MYELVKLLENEHNIWYIKMYQPNKHIQGKNELDTTFVYDWDSTF